MACAKCKQGVPFDGDTWCLACISWEQIEIELNSPWHSKGVRDLGTEVVVTAAKQLRALRNLSSSLRSAGESRSAASQGDKRSRSAGITSRELPPPPPAPIKAEKAAESDYETDEEEEESEKEEEDEVTGAHPKADPARRPPEPAVPPKPKEVVQQDTFRPSEREAEDRSRKKKKKKKNKGRDRDRGRRGGRKHQGLHRTLEDPSIRVHRKRPGAFWDTQSRLEEREPLARRREQWRE